MFINKYCNTSTPGLQLWRLALLHPLCCLQLCCPWNNIVFCSVVAAATHRHISFYFSKRSKLSHRTWQKFYHMIGIRPLQWKASLFLPYLWVQSETISSNRDINEKTGIIAKLLKFQTFESTYLWKKVVFDLSCNWQFEVIWNSSL